MSRPGAYRIEPLGGRSRTGFSCGIEALDRYFKQQSGQESRRHVASCFVGVNAADGAIGGYYTLSATSVLLEDLQDSLRKKLPRYPEVPAALLGRLAVDLQHRSKGLGKLLLYDAMRRTLKADLAATVLIADAKDEAAASFYCSYDFIDFGKGCSWLYLPVAEIAKVFSRAQATK